MASLIIGIAIGFAVGVALTGVSILIKGATGVFRVDTSNPEKDIYRIDLGDSLERISTCRYVILKVDSKSNLSQE